MSDPNPEDRRTLPPGSKPQPVLRGPKPEPEEDLREVIDSIPRDPCDVPARVKPASDLPILRGGGDPYGEDDDPWNNVEEVIKSIPRS